MGKIKSVDEAINISLEKNRRESKLSHKTRRQLSLLERYYKIDMVNRVITIPFHYKDINEIIAEDIESKSYPVIKREILLNISDIMHSVPREFQLDIDIKIDNYRGYNPKIISQSVIDTFETFQYDFEKEERNSMLKVVALTVLGIVIFAWLFYLCSKHWFGQSGDPMHDTIHELIYTIGAVLLWEAVYIVFLPEREYKDISSAILHRIRVFCLLDKNNKCLVEINNKLVNMQWVLEARKEKTARKFLLLSGTTLICLALVNLIDVVEASLLFKSSPMMSGIHIAFLLITSTIGFLAGIGAISYYRDKGPFRSLVSSLGLIAFLANTGSIIFLSFFFDSEKQVAIKGLVLSSITLVFVVLYFISIYRINKKYKKKK